MNQVFAINVGLSGLQSLWNISKEMFMYWIYFYKYREF